MADTLTDPAVVVTEDEDDDGWPEFDPTDPSVLAEHARDLREDR